MVPPKLTLQAGHWYGWQMVPGYIGQRSVPYFSPIHVRTVHPHKTGRRTLTLQFINAQYAGCVQDFSLDLHILKHADDYIVAEVLDNNGDAPERVGIISHIEFEWIRRFCPELWSAQPPDSFGSLEQNNVSLYLDALFFPSQ